MLFLLTRIKLRQLLLGSGGRKKRSAATYVMLGILYLFCAVGMFGMFFVLGSTMLTSGLERLYLSLTAILVFALSLVTSMFSLVNQIYAAKDNHLLLAMPIKPRNIVLSRLIAVVVRELLLSALFALPAYVVFAIYKGFDIFGLLTFSLSVVCMAAIATAVGAAASFLVYRLMSLIKNKHLKTFGSTVLMIGFLIFYYTFIGRMDEGIENLAALGDAADRALSVYAFPAAWFAEGTLGSPVKFLMLLGLTAVISFITVSVLVKGFRPETQSAEGEMSKNAADIKAAKAAGKARSPIMAVAAKDITRFFSSSGIILNAGLGALFALAISIFMVIKHGDILPYLGTFSRYTALVGAVGIAFCSCTAFVSSVLLSLEGENLWVLKSSPLKTGDILMGKTVAHLLTMYPTALLGSVILCFLPGTTTAVMLLTLLIPAVFSAASALLGTLCNLMLPKLDWENAVTAVKQSISPMVYMLLSILLLIAGLALAVLLAVNGIMVELAALAAAVFFGVFALAACKLLYSGWAAKRFANLG